MLLKTLPTAIALTFLVGCGGGSGGDSNGDRVVDDETTTGADTQGGETAGSDGDTTTGGTTGGTTSGGSGDGTGTGTTGATDGSTDGESTAGGTIDGATGGGTDGTDTGSTDGSDGSTDGTATAGGTTDGSTGGTDGSDGSTDGTATAGGTMDGSTGGTDGSGEGGTTGGDTTGGDPDDPASALSLDLSPLDVERFTADNFEAALTTAIAALRGEDMIDRVRELRTLERKIVEEANRFQELNVTVPGYNRVLLCPDGGRIDSNLQDVDEPLAGAGHLLEQCAIDGTTYNGLFSFTLDGDDRRGVDRETIAFGALPITFLRADGTAAAISSLGITETAATDELGNRALSTLFANAYLEVRSGDATIAYSLVLTESGDSAIPDVRVGTLAPAANARYQTIGPSSIEFPSGTTVSLSSSNAFLAESGEENFAAGQLEVRVRTSDRTGNVMTMSADNGDPATFDVLIFDDSISVQTFTLPWSERFRFERPDSLFD